MSNKVRYIIEKKTGVHSYDTMNDAYKTDEQVFQALKSMTSLNAGDVIWKCEILGTIEKKIEITKPEQ